MKVENQIPIYSIDGVDTVIGEKRKVIIKNVWNKKRFIELQIGEGIKVIVLDSDVLKAINNSTNNDD